MLDERDSIIRDNELGRWRHLTDLLWLIRDRSLVSYYQTTSEVISFSSTENTPELVIMGDILRRSGEYEMPVRCDATGQEYEGKKDKHCPAHSLILLKSSHSRCSYGKPHFCDVKLRISSGLFATR